MNDILLIPEEIVKDILTMEDAIRAVEEALMEKAAKRVQMPPKTYIFFRKYNGDFRTMPSYLEGLDVAGVKAVNVHPNNPHTYNKPSVMATIILLDPRTGKPISIMGGTTITRMRTGAIGGVATKYLGRKNSETLGLLGAGTQARTQLSAISKILDLKEVRVYDKVDGAVRRFIEEAMKTYNYNFIPCKGVEECVKEADVVSTTTPVTNPIIMDEWITPGTHINAIGADAPGKEELDPKILKRAKIVVDDLDQAVHSGEVNVPIEQGLIRVRDIYGELCEVVSGEKTGRESEDEITVFDSTGLSIQDMATAAIVYNRAKKRKVGEIIYL